VVQEKHFPYHCASDLDINCFQNQSPFLILVKGFLYSHSKS